MSTLKPENASRRRLAKGAAAVPVVLSSLLSKNALGNTYLCTVSGQVSGNMSPTGNDDAACEGKSLSYYKDQYRNKSTKFKDLFGSDHRWGNVLVRQVLNGETGNLAISGSILLAQRATVVFLNAAHGSYYVEQIEVGEIFRALFNSQDHIRPSGEVLSYEKANNLLRLLAGF